MDVSELFNVFGMCHINPPFQFVNSIKNLSIKIVNKLPKTPFHTEHSYAAHV